jgi:amidase
VGTELIYANNAWPFVGCFKASSHPAINISLGLGKEGLPLGVQIVGPYWSEPALLAFAKQASTRIEGFIKPAGFAG